MRLRHIAGLLIITGLLLSSMVMMAGCGQDTSAPVLSEAVADADTTLATTSEDTSSDVETLPTVGQVEPFTDVACLDCHTDQVRLVDLAAPEEETEKLSEGPG